MCSCYVRLVAVVVFVGALVVLLASVAFVGVTAVSVGVTFKFARDPRSLLCIPRYRFKSFGLTEGITYTLHNTGIYIYIHIYI